MLPTPVFHGDCTSSRRFFCRVNQGAFAPAHPVGARLAGEGGLTADRSLTAVPRSTVGARLAGDDGLIADLSLVAEYISIAAVTATYGFALTATHLAKRRTPAQRQVTKRLLPLHVRCLAGARHALTPALLRGSAAMGHPWPSAAKPASCRFTHCAMPAYSASAWFNGGQSQSKAKARRPTADLTPK